MTSYVPLAAVVASAIVGFSKEEVNPFGPVHVKVYGAVPVAFANKFKSLAEQSVFGMYVNVGVTVGDGVTVIVVVAKGFETHPFTITVNS